MDIRKSGYFSDVKAIIVLRNQADWIASRYAQRSWRNLWASQSDFERQVKNVLSNNRSHVDWFRHIELLNRALGRNKVLVLFYEELFEDPLTSGIIQEFSGCTCGNINLALSSPVNVRRNLLSEKKSWRIRPFSGGGTQNSIANVLSSDFFVKRNIDKLIRGWLVKTIDSVSRGARLENFLNFVINRNRPKDFQLSEETTNQIEKAMAVSNLKLADLTGKDVFKLGY